MMNQNANVRQCKAEIFPVREDAANVTGFFDWQLEPESVNISFGRILAPVAGTKSTKPKTLEN
jgi:hypothetical protein